ncbi:DUF3888 domain-containing protein [Desulfosporosinus sp. PR]|uniref:DUF3888 domain-containing protein n=1 Tax=Candidatus Desulfosporosinus nitrosoreducens TaxID=3401928 RepID=UPI0027F9B259|nr:DUF3888 domain-containing protein [Desulfosporosinus sp. PR]MDQ7094804.1 DUF3888 domain-containing protein [Desulfosporosinus sp. PR]
MTKHKLLVKISLIAIVSALTIASVVITQTYATGQTKAVVLSQPQTGNQETELYKEMLITSLNPYLQQSITNYYGQNVMAPPYMVKVIDAKKPDPEQVYEVKFEVEPYIGAHNEVGIDHVTLRISPNKIEVINFEHIKSFPLASNLQSQFTQ